MRSISLGHGSGTSWRLLLAEEIGPPACPMMRRWVLQTPLGGLRLHHFLRGDGDRNPHDHPFGFVTLVLRGSYVDVSDEGRDKLRVGSVRCRPAHHAHRVETDGCWTLVLCSAMRRRWGFLTERGWVPWREYHALNGYPACADEDSP